MSGRPEFDEGIPSDDLRAEVEGILGYVYCDFCGGLLATIYDYSSKLGFRPKVTGCVACRRVLFYWPPKGTLAPTRLPAGTPAFGRPGGSL